MKDKSISEGEVLERLKNLKWKLWNDPEFLAEFIAKKEAVIDYAKKQIEAELALRANLPLEGQPMDAPYWMERWKKEVWGPRCILEKYGERLQQLLLLQTQQM